MGGGTTGFGPGWWVWLQPFNTHDRLKNQKTWSACCPLEIHHTPCVRVLGESTDGWECVTWGFHDDYDEWWMIITVWQKNTYICTDSWHLYRLVKTSICTGILLTTVYGLDFRHRRSHVHMIISDGQQSFIPRTKPWKPQDHDDLRCQVVAFLSQLPRGPKVT